MVLGRLKQFIPEVRQKLTTIVAENSPNIQKYSHLKPVF
jgi:hypothetical protein